MPMAGQQRRIGFVATRLLGTDGVTLEAAKWIRVLEGEGHRCFFLSGEGDGGGAVSVVVPEMHFQHPEVQEIYLTAFTSRIRPPATTERIHQLAKHLRQAIARFVEAFDVEILIVENALAIPLNLPLGLALTEARERRLRLALEATLGDEGGFPVPQEDDGGVEAGRDQAARAGRPRGDPVRADVCRCSSRLSHGTSDGRYGLG
jgi:hypothetical protein